MPIEPDDKDWTWVLERPCPECGFDASTFPAVEVAGLIRSNAAAWGGSSAVPAEELRRRPSEERWSTLEYACHVRDVCRLYDERLDLMLRLDDPLYPNWDQDATAVEDDYNGQDPATVAAELQNAALRLAEAFERVDGWAVAAKGSAQRRRPVQRRHVQPLPGARPGPPSLRRDGGAGSHRVTPVFGLPARGGRPVNRGRSRAESGSRWIVAWSIVRSAVAGQLVVTGAVRAVSTGSGLAGLGDDGQHLGRPEQRRDGHRDGPGRDGVEGRGSGPR